MAASAVRTAHIIGTQVAIIAGAAAGKTPDKAQVIRSRRGPVIDGQAAPATARGGKQEGPKTGHQEKGTRHWRMIANALPGDSQICRHATRVGAGSVSDHHYLGEAHVVGDVSLHHHAAGADRLQRGQQPVLQDLQEGRLCSPDSEAGGQARQGRHELSEPRDLQESLTLALLLACRCDCADRKTSAAQSASPGHSDQAELPGRAKSAQISTALGSKRVARSN